MFEEYGTFILTALIGGILVVMLFAFTMNNADLIERIVPDEKLMIQKYLKNTTTFDSSKIPVLNVEKKVIVYIGETYDPTDEKILLAATDGQGNDVKERIHLVEEYNARKASELWEGYVNIIGADTVKTNVVGDYKVNYYYKNKVTGYSNIASCTVLVRNPYIRCEWIGFGDGQWIDTGVVPNGKSSSISLICQLTSIGGDRFIAGTTKATDGVGYKMGILTSGGKWAYASNDGQSATTRTTDVPATTAKTTLSLYTNYDKPGENIYIADGTTVSLAGTSVASAGNHITLFGNSEHIQAAKGRLYSCQIYVNGKMVRNFIPVYYKKTQEWGLWDKVNETFYANDGTGKFTKGKSLEK